MALLTKRRVTLGELPCVAVDNFDAGTRPELLVVFLHGFGASENDLVALAKPLLARSGRLARVLFPRGVLALSATNFAWWMIDVAKFMRNVMRGEMFERETPPGLESARAAVRTTIDAALAELGLGPDALVLAGFSQGGMLAIDLALHAEVPPAALAVFSSALINADVWRERAAASPPRFPIIQSHGDADAVLPAPVGGALREFFTQVARGSAEFVTHAGPHTVGDAPLDAFIALLSRLPAAAAL